MGLGGGWNTDPVLPEHQQHADLALNMALECGIDHFDHADIYNFGKAETVFGSWYQRSGLQRSQLIIQTKAGIRIGAGRNGSNTYDLSRVYLIESVKRSIDRLQCDYLDLFLLHRPDPLMDPAEVAAAFSELQETGLVRSFGTSNFPVYLTRALQHYWKDPMPAHQIQGSLTHHQLFSHLADAHTDRYELADGSEGWWEVFLTKESAWQVWGAADQGRYTEGIREGMDPTTEDLTNLVSKLAEKYTSNSNAVVLAWLLRLPVSVQPLVGTTRPERIRMSAEALDLDLSADDWYDLWLCARNRPLP